MQILLMKRESISHVALKNEVLLTGSLSINRNDENGYLAKGKARIRPVYKQFSKNLGKK